MAVGNVTSINNADQYNMFTGSDMASKIFGYYGEVAYQIPLKGKGEQYPRLTPFVRYENYNTHAEVRTGTTQNDAYNREILTTGLGLQLTPGTVFKADFQWLKNGAAAKPTNMLNIGFGYWF